MRREEAQRQTYTKGRQCEDIQEERPVMMEAEIRVMYLIGQGLPVTTRC